MTAFEEIQQMLKNGERVVLPGANLTDSNLTGSSLTGANLSGANIRYTIGNGREIKKMKSKFITIRMSEDLRDELKRESKARKLTMTKLIRKALEALKRGEWSHE